MKVVHLMGSLKPSGMERMFLSAAKSFADSDCDAVIVGQGPMHPFSGQLMHAGYRVLTVRPIKTLLGTIAWMRLLRSERPDVVHVHTEGAFAVSVLATKLVLPKVPLVRTIHNVFMPRGRALLSRLLQGRVADFAVSSFIAVSPDVRENEGKFNRKPHLVFNWVDDKFFYERKQRGSCHQEARAAVIVGNASPIKNHILALKAVMNSGYSLYYHGDESGASFEERAILDRLQGEGRLLYRGVGDPATSLSKASVFLLPSKHEGMPIALSEALVVGVPAVVNDVPGVQWAKVFPKVLVVGDSEEEWTKALCNFPSAEARDSEDIALPLDLSAPRGVSELVSIYRSVLRGS